MKKSTFLLLLFLNLFIYISSTDIKLGSGKSFEERLKEEYLDKYEADHSMEDKMKELLSEYIEDQNWEQEKIIDKDTFMKMFINLIQRGALRQGNTGILKKLADKVIEKHGEPIIVKNLEKYFNIEELTLTYTKLLSPMNADL